MMAEASAVRRALRRMLPMIHACSHVKWENVKDFSSRARSMRERVGEGSVSSILRESNGVPTGCNGCNGDGGVVGGCSIRQVDVYTCAARLDSGNVGLLARFCELVQHWTPEVPPGRRHESSHRRLETCFSLRRRHDCPFRSIQTHLMV